MKSISKRFFLICTSVFLLSQLSFAEFESLPFTDSAQCFGSFYKHPFNFSSAEIFFLNNHFRDFQFSTQQNHFISLYPTTNLFPSSRFAMNYTTPPLPFFCSMEYKVENKLNFWIKLRAGTDADYMKSIKVYRQFDYH
jgi:hypothetical protein